MRSKAYASLDELKNQIQKTQSADDGLLYMLLLGASTMVDTYCNRPDGFEADETATARIYPAEGKRWLWIDECVAVTTVEAKDSATDDTYTEWTAADWLAGAGDPERPNWNRRPYHFIRTTEAGSYGLFPCSAEPVVRVTARWGYAEEAPETVKQATLTLAARWYKRGQSAWSDALASGDFAQLLYRQKVDPAVAMMLDMGRLVRPLGP
jgi:hypothetical protein